MYEIYFCRNLVVNQPPSLLLKSREEGYSARLSRLHGSMRREVSRALRDVETEEVFQFMYWRQRRVLTEDMVSDRFDFERAGTVFFGFVFVPELS